jgi:hypothetical protein
MTPKFAISDIRRKKKVDFFGGGKGWNKEFRKIKEFRVFKEFKEFKGFRELVGCL